MEKLKKARTYTRSAFTRTYTQFVNEYNREPIRLREVNIAFNLLKDKAGELEELNKKIFSLMIEADVAEAEVHLEIESVDEYKTKFIQAEVDAAAINNDNVRPVNTTQGAVNQQEPKRNYTLPKIQFQKYGGDLKEWLHFWGQFKKIHEDTNMSKEDKFYYLSQHILPDSKASELVGSFPPVGAMYDQVIESLKNRFGRDELLVEFYIRDLLKLVLTNATNSSENIPLSKLYDQLETHIRSLESLGVNTDTCSAMLYPLVESSLPEDILRTWQRQSSMSRMVAVVPTVAEVNNAIAHTTSKDRLVKLMSFLRAEVENEQRIHMAMSGFGLKGESTSQSVFKITKRQKNENKIEFRKNIPTATALFTAKESKMFECIFCSNNNHDSSQCGIAKKLSLEERQEAVKRNKVCFSCLKPRHSSRWCKSKEKCAWCGGKHVLLMCRDFKIDGTAKPASSSLTPMAESSLANLSANTEVFLQTLCVNLRKQNKERMVWAVLDTGSHRSYILSKTARDLGYDPISQQKVVHMLFGGTKTQPQNHLGYQVHLTSLDRTYACSFMALSQETICQDIPSVINGPWLQELQQRKILLTDVQHSKEPISLLLGADVIGKLSTGNLINLECGPTAIETKLGWTLMGKNLSERIPQVDSTLLLMSMFVQEANVSDLWSLHVLGITDPLQTKSKELHQAEVKEKFRRTIKVNDRGRYEVPLPWKENHPLLPDNKEIARKRLDNTTKKLEAQNLRNNYQLVFESWLAAGIIEEVPEYDVKEYGYYLPHRHVIKENSTTPIRPVFDASTRGKNLPSLNQCLETGPNLIELIPTMLMKFRKKKIGVISDIEKAFLQISISPKDRNVLRFLWWDKMNPGKIKVYRHCRVVFGVTSSPFLLGATIELHLEQKFEEKSSEAHRKSIQQLLKSFYVDNCVTSVDTPCELNHFIKQSTSIMRTGGFNLRGWEYNGMESLNNLTSILGLIWDKQEDYLMLNIGHLKESLPELITKRVILSVTQTVFDPIGIVSPVLLIPKLILQKLWSKSLNWDEEVDDEVKKEFYQWRQQVEVLRTLRIPRWIFLEPSDEQNISFHVFVDASQDAYTAALFVRTETVVDVKIQLIEAKSRVAPTTGTTKTTIPRLELLAATIGARLMNFVSTIMDISKVKKYYWTDSSTVLSWIQRGNQWATFVWNRVQEIRRISDLRQWRHIPGVLNPADLPSRGCTAKQLLDSRWWEGPEWLRGKPDQWPISEFSLNEGEINAEMKKTASRQSPIEKNTFISSQQLLQQNMPVKNRPMVSSSDTSYWYVTKLSKYSKILRVMAWIMRFISNSRVKKESENRIFGEISVQEINLAESALMRLTQQDTFKGAKDFRISCLGAYMDESGLIRLKTPISNRKDKPSFRYPIVLDPKHPLVTRLIEYKHKTLNHAGVQTVMNCLREQVWILTSRRAVRSVIQKCNICKRHNTCHLETIPAPLPETRIRDAMVFEVTGIDYAGPLYLKGGQKAWICLFTCAVYRAVHLELVTSLSTIAFFEVIRRFIARRGRPSIIYSDNGTNFCGTSNLLKKIDWNEVIKYSTLQKIDWRFNPPTAAWWGGWWERLIRTVKQLLKKVLKRASLAYEEMATILCDCESIINSRPITYLSEDPFQLSPLTPAMFLQEIIEVGVLDFDYIDSKNLHKRIRYRNKIRQELRKRFRVEYLGQLSRKRCSKEDNRTIQKGDVVLIGNDNQKRIDWPLGLVIEIIPGKDGHVRIVQLKTASGEIIRLIQKLYLLEMTPSDKQNDEVSPKNSHTDEQIVKIASNISEQPHAKIETKEELSKISTRSTR